jgi:hypothetical protein
MNPTLARMDRPTVLYRNSCRKCRLLTSLIVVLSIGIVRRTPNDHPAAVRLMADYGLQPTKLLLVWPCGSAVGWGVSRSLPTALACRHYKRPRRRWASL